MSIAIDPMIRGKLEQFIDRRRRWTILYAVMIGLVTWVLGVLLFTCIDAIWILDRATRSLLSLGSYTVAFIAALVIVRSRLKERDPIAGAAIEIEKSQPELRDQLLSAVELTRVNETTSSRSFIGALQQNVSSKILAVDIPSLLPLKLLTKPMAYAAVALLTCIVLMFVPQLRFGNRFARAVIPGFDIDRISRTRILIERPAPPSRTVPANEITAIVVRLEGKLSDAATLEWTTDAGDGKLPMHSSSGNHTSSTTETSEPTASFAVNLMVEEATVSYRITAGDGVTRWHRLEPRPRPEVVEFKIETTPPSYTKLPSNTAVLPDGNLKELTGTRVALRLRFNMPVKDVVMRRMNLDNRLPMRADGDQWTIDTVIDTNDRYQILAKSLETDFDNPLSPQYTITPVADAAPVVNWNQEKRAISAPRMRRELASAFSTFNLTAIVSDEMPVESVAQEVSVNRGEWKSVTLEGPFEDAEITRTWAWDLKTIRHKDRDLKAGDVVETRVVAIDRTGARGQSSNKEFIISDHEFDASKQKRLDSWKALSADVSQWKKAVASRLVTLKVEEQKDQKPEADVAEQESSKQVDLKSDGAARNAMISKMIDAAEHESEAAKLEALARTMNRVEDSLDQAAEADEAKRQDFRYISSHAETAAEMAKTEVGHHFNRVLLDNLLRMSASIQPTVRESDPIDGATVIRYLEVAVEQYKELTLLMSGTIPSLPNSTRNHVNGVVNWINEEQRKLNEAISEKENVDRARSVAKNIVDGLEGQRRGAIDGQIGQQQIERMKQTQNIIGWTRDPLNRMVSFAEQVAQWNAKVGSSNSDEVREAKEKIASANESITKLRNMIIKRLRQDGEIHRHRPEADQLYIADTHLLERVLEQLSDESFKPAEGKSMRDVYQEIAAAYHWLESGHDTTQWGRELSSLARDDRWNSNSAAGRIDAPNRIERFSHGFEYSTNGLQQAGLQGEQLGPIGNLRWSGEMQVISNEITSRRWKSENAVSVADKLDAHLVAFNVATEPIEPFLVKARNTLKAYLPSIAELARKTAQTLRESKVDEPQNADSEEAKQEVAKADEKREQAAKVADELKESLADEANVQELFTDDGRRKARNADISTKAVEQKMDQVEQAAEKAKTAATTQDQKNTNEALNDKTEAAAKAMEQIASHYEKESANEEIAAADPNESESSLKSLEEELGLTKALDQQFSRSDAIANALKTDPRELLKKLVQELKRNELMRQELDDITGQTMQEAQRTLAEQSARERELQLRLERSDPKLTVAKRELEEAIRRAAGVGEEVERSLLAAANQSAESLRDLPEQSEKRAEQAKEQLRSATEDVRTAINDAKQVNSAENALLAELKEKAKSVQETFAEASETLRSNSKPIEEILADESAKLEDKRRQEEKKQMENIQRRARDNQVQMARDQERRAGQRQQEAENQAREAKRRVEREADQLKKREERQNREPDNQGAKNEVGQATMELARAQANLDAAEAGVELTKKTSEETREHAEKVAKTELASLDQSQPAAQLANLMQSKAREELKQAMQQLKSAADRIAPIDALASNLETLASADSGQERVASDVADAAEDLARAARHQERMGQSQQAQSTAEAAQEVKAISEGAVAAATAAVEAAKQAMSPASEGQAAPTSDSGQSKAARDSLGQAQAELKSQAEKIASSQTPSTASAPGAKASSSAPKSGSQQAASDSARQMAQTLDELDRSLSASRKVTNNEGNANSQSPATLSAAAQRQAQQLAMKRAQQGTPQANSESESEPSPEATESGDGTSTSMPDAFGMESVARSSDEQWGKLRSRDAEDVSEERRAEISPEYRRQVEAYFRVIAEKAKQ